MDYYEYPDTLVIHKRRGGGPILLLLLGLIGVAVPCVTVFVQAMQSPTYGMCAAVAALWATWLYLAGVIVWRVFGKETLLLDRYEAVFRRKALIRLSSCIVSRAEIQCFRECRSDHQEDNEYLWGIEMVTLGEPVRFGFQLPDRERAWLIFRFNRFLDATGAEQLRQITPLPPPAALPSEIEVPASHTALSPSEPLTVEHPFAERPTHSAWQLLDNPDGFAFQKRGRLNVEAAGWLLFVCVLWNAMSSQAGGRLFGLMPGNNVPQGWAWWEQCLMWIPFEIIGLSMSAAFVIAVLEPFHRTTWQFGWDRIVRQSRWPVYRHTRTRGVDHLDRLQLRRRTVSDASRPSFWQMATDPTGPKPFELALVAGANIDLCVITDLTEAEARWMAGLILDQRQNWFRR